MFDLFKKYKVIPVVKIDDANDAVPIAKALIDGGLPVAEITFRTDAAKESIKRIVSKFPQMLVGAGTVLSIEQAKAAVEAGAKFLVSPGFNPKVVKWCQENDVLILPGCITPTEIEMALEFGITTLKFFPAEQAGGLARIKALCAPYTMVNFVPTGGISLENMKQYLDFPKVIAVGGSFMVKDEFIKNKDWAAITECTRKIGVLL